MEKKTWKLPKLLCHGVSLDLVLLLMGWRLNLWAMPDA